MSDETKKSLRCSFCGKREEEVRRMIQGPGARICDQCVQLCMSVLEEELGKPESNLALETPEKLPTPREIKEILEKEKLESSIYITLETLKYLKRGGRITPAAAAIGTVLNLKPVLQIQGGKLDAYAKVRGKKQAKRVIIKAVQEDLENRFAKYVQSGEMRLDMAYTGNLEEAEEFKKEVEAAFPGFDIHMDPLSLSVACHIGHGALAVTCAKKVTV